MPDDNVLELSRIDSSEGKSVFPSLKTALCVAVVNNDGSVAYLLNQAEDGKYVKFVKNTAIKDFPGSFAPIAKDALTPLFLHKGMRNKELRRDTVPKFMGMLNQFDWGGNRIGLRPLFACEITGDSDEIVKRSKKRLNRKSAMIVSDVSAINFLKILSGFIKGSFETTFWGAVVFPDYRGRMNIVLRGRLARILRRARGALLVQLVDDPGRIVVVSSGACVKVEVATE